MKVGLLADIHGNEQALLAVLSAAEDAEVESLVIAGDIVGYYYEPGKVIELLEQWSWQSVRGNHEELLRDRLNDGQWEEERQQHGSGLRVACRLPSATRDRLINLPHPLHIEIDGAKILVCHGSPWDISEYIYPDASPEKRGRVMDAATGYDLLVLGHTHYPLRWEKGRLTVVNPGSVGQPRDRRPGACWALWDTKSRAIEFHREAYDFRTIQDRARAIDPDIPYLWEVLVRS